MLEACLNNKIIRDFLNNYQQSRWQKLIPSLIEIAILNLNSSFHTVIFSEEDIKNIINELKLGQNQPNIDSKPKNSNRQTHDQHDHVIFAKPSNQWRTADGGIPPISGTKEPEYINNSTLTNNSKYSKDNKDIARENMINRQIIKNTKSKIKEQVDNDKRNYYNKMNENNQNQPIEKINYAISYDKNLQPEVIEKTTINKNIKGGKKIVEKMTQEEYEQKFPDEEQNLQNNEYEEEEEENEIANNNNDENEEEECYYDAQDLNQNYNAQNKKNFPIQNNQNKGRKNLYHYKNDFNNKNNNIILNNMNQGKVKNAELVQNPQQSFNPNFKNNNQENIRINQNQNNYINIENNANEPQKLNNNYNYNPIPSEQYNNYKIGISESDDKSSSKFIGIEQKYQKKIDELEKNIINAGDNNLNNIDNYANKLNVNITNMEEYSKNNNNNYQYNNMNNIDEEAYENEENNLSDIDVNDMDGGVLSQMSNMSERTKSLLKRTMDEYPPLEEDTLFEQTQK